MKILAITSAAVATLAVALVVVALVLLVDTRGDVTHMRQQSPRASVESHDLLRECLVEVQRQIDFLEVEGNEYPYIDNARQPSARCEKVLRPNGPPRGGE